MLQVMSASTLEGRGSAQKANRKRLRLGHSFPPKTAHAASLGTGSPATQLGKICSFS